MRWRGRCVTRLEDFDDAHGSATSGTEQPVRWDVVVVRVLMGFNTEELTGFDEVLSALPVGKEAVVSDAMEAVG